MSRFPKLDQALKQLAEASESELDAVGEVIAYSGRSYSVRPAALHVRRLATLAQYLAELPENYAHFHMGYYHTQIVGLPEPEEGRLLSTYEISNAGLSVEFVGLTGDGMDLNPCGTVACALGHAPLALNEPVQLAGLPDLPEYREDWRTYGERMFGHMDRVYWEYFFGGYWEDRDNSAAGAAARIAHLLFAVLSQLESPNRDVELDDMLCARDPLDYEDLLEAE